MVTDPDPPSSPSPAKRQHSFWLSYCCSISEYDGSAEDIGSSKVKVTGRDNLTPGTPNCENSGWNCDISGMESKSTKTFIQAHYQNVVPSSYSSSDTFHYIHQRSGNNSLGNILRVPLWIGSCLGLIPIQGSSQRKGVFTWLHCGTFISGFVTASLLLHTICISYSFLIQMFTEKNSARDFILSISGVWFYSAGTIVYVFFLLKAKQLSQFFQTWKETSLKISHYLLPDKHLERNVTQITLLVLLDCIAENILFHFHSMTSEQRKDLSSRTFSQFLQDYYHSNQYMNKFFDYSPTISLAMLITNKLATFAWNFGDLILILVARVLHERFWALNEYIRAKMNSACSKQGDSISISWTSVRNSFLEITHLLQEANKQFSPLIWLSCTTNVFFISRQTAWLNKIYLWWSLLHLIGRALGVNLMATAMSEEAHRTFKVIQHCHPLEYNEEIRRLEIFLGGRILGLSGSGCFLITRSFVTMLEFAK